MEMGKNCSPNHPCTKKFQGFYINVVVIGLSLPVYLFMLPSYDPMKERSTRSRASDLDWVGGTLSLGAFTSGIMATNFGGTLYAWDSSQIIALFVVSGVLFIAFFLQQHFTVLTTMTARLSPFHLLRNKDVALCFVCQRKMDSMSFHQEKATANLA